MNSYSSLLKTLLENIYERADVVQSGVHLDHGSGEAVAVMLAALDAAATDEDMAATMIDVAIGVLAELENPAEPGRYQTLYKTRLLEATGTTKSGRLLRPVE